MEPTAAITITPDIVGYVVAAIGGLWAALAVTAGLVVKLYASANATLRGERDDALRREAEERTKREDDRRKHAIELHDRERLIDRLNVELTSHRVRAELSGHNSPPVTVPDLPRIDPDDDN